MNELNIPPAPWIESPTATDAIIAPNAGINHRPSEGEIKGYGGKVICESIDSSAVKSLIKAAPDLYAALEDLLEQVRFIEAREGVSYTWTDKAEAALEKVRGE